MSNSDLKPALFQTRQVRATMVVDLKYHRIRIHKSTIHLLGDPEYIQILINPNSSVIALLPSVEEDYLAHKIQQGNVSDKQSCEFYSKSLVETMSKLCKQWKADGSYRMDGQKVSFQNLILFPLSSSCPMRMQEDCNG